MSERPYARLYLDLVDDEKFASVYDNDRHFATWCRLLMIAEGAWPASAHLPRTARTATIEELRRVGLIDLQGGDRYRIHGLDAERASRARESRNGGTVRAESAVRDGSGRFLPAGVPALEPAVVTSAGASGGDQRVQPAKPSQAETSQALSARDPVVVYANLAGGYPSRKAMDWIDQLTESFGAEAVISAMGTASQRVKPGNVIGEAKNVLLAEARELSQREKEAEKAKITARRVDGMYARRLEWFEHTGKWDPAWGDPPVAA